MSELKLPGWLVQTIAAVAYLIFPAMGPRLLKPRSSPPASPE